MGTRRQFSPKFKAEAVKLGDRARRCSGASCAFLGSDRAYGARRISHDVLALGGGGHSGLTRIERLMREQALRARRCRRGLPKDHGECSAIADNLLDRQFQADAPNRKWVDDVTCIRTAEGWLYVAVLGERYSRRIVGWSMHSSMTSQLAAGALMMAVWRRGRPQELLHHSAQCSQSTSEHFQCLLNEQGIVCNMSRAGEVWDNSAMESFFRRLKTERTARKVYRPRKQDQMCSATSGGSATRRVGARHLGTSVR